MSTRITVGGAVTVVSILHGLTDRETVEQEAGAVDEAHEASFPVHNTLSLRVEGGEGSLLVEASDWPVELTYGPDSQTVEPGGRFALAFSDADVVTIREAPPMVAPDPVVSAPAEED